MDDRVVVVNAEENVAEVVDHRLRQVRHLVAGRGQHPVDDREAGSVVAFLDALDRLPRPFDQDADPTHVTSSAIVIGPSGVVLLKHKRLGIWVQPGGHLEPGEELADGARREAAEETGLVLADPPGGPELVHVDVHPGGRGHTHLDLRWLLIGSGRPAPPAGESPHGSWFGWDEAIARSDPGLRGALRTVRPLPSA